MDDDHDDGRRARRGDQGDSATQRMWAVASLWVPMVVLAGAATVLMPHAPRMIATHWSFGQRAPDAFATPTGLLLELGAIAFVCATAGTVTTARMRDVRTARLTALVAGMLGGVFTATWIGLVVAASSVTDVTTMPVGWAAVVPVVGALWGVVPAAVIRAGGGTTVDLPVPTSHTGAVDGTSTWVGHVGSCRFAVTGVAAAILAVAVAVVLAVLPQTRLDDWWPPLLTLLVLGGSVAVLGRARITIDASGFRLHSEATGVRLMRVPLDEVADVAARDVSPGNWGGWGLRVTSRGTAFVVRSGPGIVITTTRGRLRAVSCAAPGEPVAVLRALTERTAGAGTHDRRD